MEFVVEASWSVWFVMRGSRREVVHFRPPQELKEALRAALHRLLEDIGATFDGQSWRFSIGPVRFKITEAGNGA